ARARASTRRRLTAARCTPPRWRVGVGCAGGRLRPANVAGAGVTRHTRPAAALDAAERVLGRREQLRKGRLTLSRVDRRRSAAPRRTACSCPVPAVVDGRADHGEGESTATRVAPREEAARGLERVQAKGIGGTDRDALASKGPLGRLADREGGLEPGASHRAARGLRLAAVRIREIAGSRTQELGE